MFGTSFDRVTASREWTVDEISNGLETRPPVPVRDYSEYPGQIADEGLLRRNRLVHIGRHACWNLLSVGLPVLGILLGLVITETSAAAVTPQGITAHQQLNPAAGAHPLPTKLIRRIEAAGHSSDPGASGISLMILPTAGFLAFPKLPRRFHTEYRGRVIQVYFRPLARPG
jgi:hypothetical protein